MPRLARTVFAGVPHHVTQRGNRRDQVFFTDDDRHAYLAWLKDYAEKFIRTLEKLTGRALRYRPPGRPKKQHNQKG